MKSFVMILCVSVWGCLAAHAVTVNGVAMLSGQQNHSGIKVLFREVSPSAQTDSTLTNSWGVFLITLQPGVYDVEYSHADFALYQLPDQIFLFDTALDSVTLMPPLSGYLSGTIGPGDFQVTDSIVVNTGQSLTIQPGTRLWFDGMHQFIIRGLLTAVGTEQDSIVFTRRYETGLDTAWNGMLFLFADDQCRMEYVCVERAFRSYGTPYYGDGAALYCDGTDIQLRTCVFRYDAGYVSGVFFYRCIPLIVGCRFHNGQYNYSALNWYNASPVIDSCVFENNEGGAISGYGDSLATIVRCTFREDEVFLSCPARIEESVFDARSNTWGELSLSLSHPDSIEVSHCTFFGRGDYEYGTVRVTGNATISSCTIFSMTGLGIYFSFAAECQVRYCDIFAPSGQTFGFNNDDPSNGPPAIGLIALTNANGDSCDTYYNIFADPQFVDTANGNFHLQATSPCIDAGDPELPLDPDGTIADIGAFYFDQLSADDDYTLPPSSFVLSAYPNPFNNETRIVFNLPRAGQTKLIVYDLVGREITTLFDGALMAGRHELNLNASGWASGIYFYRLQSAGLVQTRKIVLLR